MSLINNTNPSFKGKFYEQGNHKISSTVLDEFNSIVTKMPKADEVILQGKKVDDFSLLKRVGNGFKKIFNTLLGKEDEIKLTYTPDAESLKAGVLSQNIKFKLNEIDKIKQWLTEKNPNAIFQTFFKCKNFNNLSKDGFDQNKNYIINKSICKNWASFNIPVPSSESGYKLHIYADTLNDWTNVFKIISPKLIKDNIGHKTFDSLERLSNNLNNPNQKGKAFTIYFKKGEHELLAQTAAQMDNLLCESSLTRNDAKIVGDRTIGKSGRVSYRYDKDASGNYRHNNENSKYMPDGMKDKCEKHLKQAGLI